ncbi:hypothetical protein, partial [Enterobacter hormaechei]|uniref:hypothetical protein n=1 Tax=Enterobacter hormaechei TaxID=158836 RepID=UPI001952B401
WDADAASLSSLIRLRSAKVDDDALTHGLDVGMVQPDQLRTAEPAREADQQEGTVPDIPRGRTHPVEDCKQFLP